MRIPSPIFHVPHSRNVLAGLRVCFLAGTLGQGGAERQLFYLLSTLKDSGANPLLICLTDGEHWQHKIEALGIPVTVVAPRRSQFQKLVGVIRAVRSFRPHVFQSQHFYTNAYCGIAGRWLAVPTVAAVRNDGLSEVRGSNRWARIAGLQLSTIVAANSRKAIENLVAEGFARDRFHFLPNVIDTRQFQPPPGSWSRFRPRGITVLGIGRLVRQKGFDLFLEIVKQVAVTLRIPIHAVIAGDGPERGALERTAQQIKNVGVSVEFVGRIANPIELYHSADVFLLTSEWEGTPNVVMEAMACGLPVIASNVGGVAGLIADGETGFLFEPSQRQNAIARLTELAQDPVLANQAASRARRFIEANHSTSLLREFLGELYQKVFDSK